MTTEIDVYPVGWLAALRRAWRAATTRRYTGHRRTAWHTIHQEWRHTIHQARAGDWHAVRQTLDGWHAEPNNRDSWEPRKRRRCGTGWTRRRALRSLHRHGYRPTTQDTTDA